MVTPRRIVLRMGKFSGRMVQKIKVHILYSTKFFFPKIVTFIKKCSEIMVKSDRPQTTIWHGALHVRQLTQIYKYPILVFNTNCSCTVTIVNKSDSIILYVNFFSVISLFYSTVRTASLCKIQAKFILQGFKKSLFSEFCESGMSIVNRECQTLFTGFGRQFLLQKKVCLILSVILSIFTTHGHLGENYSPFLR